AALQKETGWQDIPVVVITARDLDAKDRERLNSGVQTVLVKERFRPADLVERVRRLVQTKPTIGNGMEAASGPECFTSKTTTITFSCSRCGSSCSATSRC